MIRIIDRTLSCLDNFQFSDEDLAYFLGFLIESGVEAIELSEEIYRRLLPLPEFVSYRLRIEREDDMAKYPEINQFVCRNATTALPNLCAEIRINDMRDAYTITRYAEYEKVRAVGLDDLLLGDYRRNFEHLKRAFRMVEFCPTNNFFCAAALAAEWVLSGSGSEIVTSFGGVGGFAPTEELIMILRGSRVRKVSKTYEFFPEMAAAFQKIIAEPFPANKPVLGKHIFHVESGIHVDGILKQPKCYEPFPPDIVGLSRKIVLGKHSGGSSVRAKMDELQIKCPEEKIPIILESVKTLGAKKNGAVTSREFTEICADCGLGD